MRLRHRAGSLILASTLALSACGGDSNDPTPFDPVLFAGDFGTVFNAYIDLWDGEVGESFVRAAQHLAAASNTPMVRAGVAALQGAPSAARTRAARDTFVTRVRTLLGAGLPAGAAVVLPNDMLGTTWEWDAGAGEYVASDRAGAPANGVRFVMYVVDGGTGYPVEPLEEIGHLELTDLSTASADIARVVVVTDDVTRFDYRVTRTGDDQNGTFGADGYVSHDGDRIEVDIDIGMAIDGTTQAWTVDAGLEFEMIPMSVTYRSDDLWTGSAEHDEWEVSVRGPHGFVDLRGSYDWEDGSDAVEETVYEVNGRPFAEFVCDEETCAFLGTDGEPLSEDERNALDIIWGVGELAWDIMDRMMGPTDMFVF
jgi:hypothetical protein